MRANSSASAGVLFLLAGAATVCAFSCTHDLDDFRSGRPDTAPALDSSLETAMIDTSVDAIDSGIDTSSVDTTQPDTRDTAEPDSRDTAVSEVDTGPPPPDPPCTAVGPLNTTCIEAVPKVAGDPPFRMGAANAAVCSPAGCSAEMPEVPVRVSQYWIDTDEVTVGRFRTWWNLSPRPWPAAGSTFFQSSSKDLKWRNAVTWPSAPPSEPPTIGGCFWRGGSDSSNDDKPMNCVDWFTALAFCLAEGKRLPTEAEWELAASGAQDRLFPWSPAGTEDDPLTPVTCAHALNGSSCTPANAARETTIWGLSRWGVRNMAGSLAEWTLDGYLPNLSTIAADSLDPVTDPGSGALRTTRGGSYVTPISHLRASYRPAAGVSATTPDAQIGFRCAKRP